MSCNSRPGPKAVAELVEFITDERISQADWHELKRFAESDGLDVSRLAADDRVADAAFDRFAEALRVELSGQHDGSSAYDKHLAKAVKNARKQFTSVSNSCGTVAALNYLSDYGTEDVLFRIRSVREGDWEPEIDFLVGREPEELTRRLADVDAHLTMLLENERDFGVDNRRRAERANAEREAILEAQRRQSEGL